MKKIFNVDKNAIKENFNELKGKVTDAKDSGVKSVKEVSNKINLTKQEIVNIWN